MTDRRWWRGGMLPVVGVSAVVFWLTAYPTITWWDSSQYSLAAATLGVTGPPGSLLLTLLGWPVAHLPFLSPAHALNLFAGLLAAAAAGLVCLVATRLTRMSPIGNGSSLTAEPRVVLAGTTLGALTFAFSGTLWEHAIKFTPYVLTAVFTGLILWTMLRWWDDADDPGAWRHLVCLGLLFGLDFSVHRTNALLFPALLGWILVRRPRTLLAPRAWLGGGAGLAAGLTVQLLVIPIAATTDSVLNFGEPGNWARFWDYVSLEQLGGGFLVQFLPRKAALWSQQTADLLRVLRADFLRWDGPLGPLGILPALIGVGGLVHLWRRHARLGGAFTLVLLLQAAMTVLYFNIPAGFFRSFDRHYLPVCVTFGIAMAYGFGVLFGEAVRLAAAGRRVVAALGGLLLLLVPVAQLAANWAAHDASNRYFAADFAGNALRVLPPDAILFTNGDNDTFPLLYVQAVEGVRPDVQIVNRSLANTFWFVDQILRRDPAFPLSLTREERLALRPRQWRDTTLVIPVAGTAGALGLPAGTPVPDAITLDQPPTPPNLILPADLVTLDLLHTNRWRRPLCYSTTVGPQGMGWLRPFGRLEGLYWRVVPVADPPPDLEVLRANLLEAYDYRGYADPRVRLDDVSRSMGHQYALPFLTLVEQERERGTEAGCRTAAQTFAEVLPSARLGGVANARATCR